MRDGSRLRFDPGLFARGLERLLYGATKILVLGAFVGWHLDSARAKLAPDSYLAAYAGCVSYGWHLYFQFAGWSDVAISVSNLIGRQPPENFRFPFLAHSPADFWTRWHATLSSFCRTTIYMPVAARTRSAVVGVVASLIVLGLWHELSLRYLVWASWHALAVVAFGRLETARRRRAAHRSLTGAGDASPFARAATLLAGILVTQHVVFLSFAFTSTPDLETGVRLFLELLTLGLLDL